MSRLGLAVLTIITYISSALVAHAFDVSRYAEESRLATGVWVRISVSESGVYAITADDAARWGLGSLNNVRVFGYGGTQLSEYIDSSQPDDLPQVPVIRQDGRLLFYAKGATSWDATTFLLYKQRQHPYATAGYYFLTSNSLIPDLEITRAEVDPVDTAPITTFTAALYHEQDMINPGETGRKFLGDDFRYNLSQTFKFTLDDFVDGGEVKVQTNFAAKTVGTRDRSTISFKYNGINLPEREGGDYLASSNSDITHIHYTFNDFNKRFNLTGTNELNYTVTFNPVGTLNLARLDYITVNYPRQLRLKGSSLFFVFDEKDTQCTYALSGADDATHIWDVTGFTPIEMNAKLSGATATFSPIADDLRQYIAFSENGTFPSPTLTNAVKNQNLHGEAVPDMIIISPTEYLAQAERVAEMHRSVDKMRVLVVDQQNVYNEFSSGTPDAMAYRNMCKMYYDRGTDTEGHHLGYLLLFGNGSYDNRQITDRLKADTYPMLLTWQSESSATEQGSFTTDDYFTLLADNLSTPLYTAQNKRLIAVGRFPVKSVDEARTSVNELIKYVTKPDYGAWKTSSLNVADDEDQAQHMEQAEQVITRANEYDGEDFMFHRVYIDAFTSQNVGSGRYYPEARDKMYRMLSEGVVWWNYTGHASTTGWTGDGLLTRSDVLNKLFYKHRPILYAATCEFTRYDSSTESSGETIFLNSGGGAIAVVCPPRLVYIDRNGPLNDYVARYIFSFGNDGKPRRLGDIIMNGKNAFGDMSDNTTRYFLFGDPAMRPAFPELKAVVETINGEAVSPDNMPIFKARQTLNITGHIEDRNGNRIDGFNGTLISSLYDCETAITTHGYGDDGKPFSYNDRNTRLAVTVDTVKQGKFDFNITIPSEVIALTENYLPSRINLYAYNAADTTEAMGSNTDFYIYGYDDTVIADEEGPNIEYLGLNSQAFNDGDDVNESPLVIATVSDESGVNFSNAGIGHELTLTLDNNTTYSDVMTYYTPSHADKGTRGSISYQLSDLTNGEHTLTLKAWDVYNNSSSKSIVFNVVKGLKPEIADIYCDANPASVEANFYIKHNRPDANVNVTLEIIDLMGRRVWSTTQTGKSDMFTSFPINWNLCDMSGNRVARGIYIYRATLSTDGIQEVTKAKRIAVTGQ